MPSNLRSILKNLISLPFAIGVLAWLGVVSWQTFPYSNRLFGFDSANPGGAPLRGLACPLYADGKVGVRADIPVSAPIIYQTNFSIIPADVSQGFQPLCAPRTIGRPPEAHATCYFDIPNLVAVDSSVWFLRVTAAQEESANSTVLTEPYGGVCLIRTGAVLVQDLVFAGLVGLTGLGLVVLGTFLWSIGGLPARIAMVLAVPLIWYIGAVAVSLAMLGSLEWFPFSLSFLLIAAIIAFRVWQSTWQKGSA